MKIYLITYINTNQNGDDTIEGFVRNREDFDKWLLKHNEGRVRDGHEVEKDFEFEIKEIEEVCL